MRRVLSIVLAVFLLFSFVACSTQKAKDTTSGEKTSDTSQSAASKPEKIILVTSSGTSHDPIIEKWVEKTGIQVEKARLGEQDVRSYAMTAFAAKSSEIDLAYAWAGTTAEYANAGHLEDITDILTKEEKDAILPGALEAVMYHGRIYGLPIMYSLRSFFVNEALFEKAGITKKPTTWDELVDCCVAINNPENDEYGILCQFGGNNSIAISFQDFLVLTGGKFVDDKNNILFNNEAGLEALEKLVEISKLGLIDPAAYGIDSGPVKRDRWIQGKDGMMWEWAATYAYTNDPANNSPIAGKVTPIVVPGIKTSGAITGSEGWVISKYSKNKDAALDLLKYVCSAESQKDVCIRTGWYPAIRSVFDDKEVLASSPMFGVAAEQSKYPTYRFAAPYLTELQDILGPQILLALEGKKSPKEALDDAAKEAEAVIAPFRK